MSEKLEVSDVYLSRQQARLVDQVAVEEFGFHSLMLMENAAAGAARYVVGLDPGGLGPTLIVCGGGNNGGDGLAMARHLYLGGAPVGVLLMAEPDRLSPDCRVNWNIVGRTGLACWAPSRDRWQSISTEWQEVMGEFSSRFGTPAWVVDALLGTGSSGPVRDPFASLIDQLNHLPATGILALDLPTGWDCDQGPTDGAMLRADITYTFVSKKRSFNHPMAPQIVGKVVVGQIGTPPEVLQRVLDQTGPASTSNHD